MPFNWFQIWQIRRFFFLGVTNLIVFHNFWMAMTCETRHHLTFRPRQFTPEYNIFGAYYSTALCECLSSFIFDLFRLSFRQIAVLCSLLCCVHFMRNTQQKKDNFAMFGCDFIWAAERILCNHLNILWMRASITPFLAILHCARVFETVTPNLHSNRCTLNWCSLHKSGAGNRYFG